jgi:hypothetical protein
MSDGDVNLFDSPRASDEGDPPGYEVPYARLGPLLGASALGMTVYELNEGNSICPYHYEYPDEEWLIVLEGTPSLRDPEGEHDLARGDVVCFPTGPTGHTRSPTASPAAPSSRCSRRGPRPPSPSTPTATRSAYSRAT